MCRSICWFDFAAQFAGLLPTRTTRLHISRWDFGVSDELFLPGLLFLREPHFSGFSYRKALAESGAGMIPDEDRI